MCFSICQVPVIYSIADHSKIDIYFTAQDSQSIEGLELSKEISDSLFQRRGEVSHIHVFIKESILK